MTNYRFANKPGVMPGRPAAAGAINDLKHVARIESRQNGLSLNCRKLTRVQASLVIASCGSGRSQNLTQARGAVSIHMGGAR